MTLGTQRTQQLDVDYDLSDEQVEFYRRNGFVQLNDVITGETLGRFRDAVAAAVDAETGRGRQGEASAAEPARPRGTYESIFIQKVNLWERHAAVRAFTLSRRLGNLAARLSGRPARLWHDQALFKEPRTGSRTPWHQDTHYWPHVQKRDQLSIWVALRDATVQNGCMSFLPQTHHIVDIPAVNLGNPQEVREIDPRLKGIKPVTCELRAGSCTFHNGLAFHYAGPNKTDGMREAFAILYMPVGTTYSGAGHVCTDDLRAAGKLAVGDELAGERFPIVSDAV
jgi:ectoine hydroxylase-related dioxygenase (phytanoyl-CoA dioxygenase family)